MSTGAGAQPRAGPAVFAGLFFTTLSTLIYEVLLTRIFSVTMWYHFAFVAVSVALFGMTAGALIVHLLPGWFPQSRVRERLAQSAVLFSVSIVITFIIHLHVPFDPKWSVGGVTMSAVSYLIISVPFFFSGIAVCLTLTRFSSQVSTLYATDLIGAALGATMLVWLLNTTRDAPSAVLAVAALAAFGALGYAFGGERRVESVAAALAVVVLAALAASNAVAAQHQQAFLRIVHVKGTLEGKPLFETWNAFSRIRVDGNRDVLTPGGVSRSPGDPPLPVRGLQMSIDANALTALIGYDGDPESVAFLRGELRALVHRIRPDSRVLIIGTGGGTDVLVGLVHDQPSITAVEMNGAIIRAVNGRYGAFTGHLDRQPGVRFVNDEGRSFVERSDDRYDIIQIPFTDTWAATGAGAFALSENGLYTVDAWESFHKHLSDRGVLSVTRWYVSPQPVEAYRLTALAVEALRRAGVEDPRQHIVLVKSANSLPGVAVADILVSKQPFSHQDVLAVEKLSAELNSEVKLTPERVGSDPVFGEIVTADDVNSIKLGYPADISAPTDDRPFFFQMVRFQDMFNRSLYGGANDYVARPVLVLFSLTVAVLGLTALCIVLPLVLTTSRRAIQGSLPLVVFFAGIGFGFLLIEIAQMQRLNLFLGHPTYALSVVLFSLLTFSGIGSLATERFVAVRANPGVRVSALWPLAALLAVIVTGALLTPVLLDHFEGETTSVRILIAVAILAPLGLLMGMPFPLGMKVASLREDAPTAFFWGINGATSVSASVLAVSISLGWGISMAFWAGGLSYTLAAVALLLAVVPRQQLPR